MDTDKLKLIKKLPYVLKNHEGPSESNKKRKSPNFDMPKPSCVKILFLPLLRK